MKAMLKISGWYKTLPSGNTEGIDDTDDLAWYFSECQDTNNLSTSKASLRQNNKYIVLHKETTVLFPTNVNVNGLDWLQIDNRAPVVVAPAPGAGGNSQ